MLTDDVLRGLSVLSQDGVKIGEVTRLVIDPGTFRIAALEVHVHKDVADRIGMPHGLFQGPTVQIPTEQVQSIGDAVILSVAAEALHTRDGTARNARTTTA